MPEVNRAMFARIAAQIGDHPETHDQTEWELSPEERADLLDLPVEECGTTRCVAGWALHFWGVDHGLGDKPLFEVCSAYLEEHPEVRGGGLSWYTEAAAHLLGLGPANAAVLFSASLDADEAYDRVVQYANGER